ncbi:hypothetical protein BKA70DRAFT_1178007 [Coprinopsis sp. MPI-PUGE-AT-0042]|nr:hypothetical protein BKA70DRAFT_1178007 [Coprinopsis sp. MPI-PUGE-AT-0042]
MTNHDDDPNGSSSDSHPQPLLLGQETSDSKKLEQVGVVAQVPQEDDAPEYTEDGPKADADGPGDFSSRGPSISTATDHVSEAGSVHSMPVVQVSDSPTSLAHNRSSPLPSPAPSMLSHRPPPSPARSQTLQEPANAAQAHPQRRARNRTTMLEGRSANRLSGFFTNLIHRRDTLMTNPRDDGAAAPTPPQGESAPASEAASRAVTPPPPPRPVTPPPPLPAPTLTELGLSLSTLTSDLSPSHFTSPPNSGAFLPPHYLLLCHAQGLDVLPLVSPPIAQPYALVRRVNFKSVVVMEQRGVLVAIAGRRDGVRVYALDEIRKAIEWRLDVEVRRERDRLRRENLKKSSTARSIDAVELRDRPGKTVKPSLSTPPPGEGPVRMRGSLLRKGSHNSIPVPSSPPPVPLIPRSPFARTPRKPSTPPSAVVQQPPVPPIPDQPPPYARTESTLRPEPSAPSMSARSRTISVSNVLSGVTRQASGSRAQDGKAADWTAESSDDEAIDIVAAGASGSQALDERTSATLSAHRPATGLEQVVAQAPPTHNRTRSTGTRRNRPSDLDLSLAIPNASTSPPSQPSPAPTLVTLRQALMLTSPDPTETGADIAADDEEEDEREGRISLAQALMESRIPDLPPLGSARPQEPILLSTTDGRNSTTSPPPDSGRTSRQSRASEYPPSAASSRRRRRRWSLLLTGPAEEDPEPPMSAPAAERTPHRFTRSHSFRSNRSGPPASADLPIEIIPATPNTPASPVNDQPAPLSSRSGRFTRIFSNAFNGRRSEERIALPGHASDSETVKPSSNAHVQAPPPKLEYVKLPGTKNALMIKAVETAKKSFLAILCGETGEKVELFAGTYRTALGLSRTFILPDSPRSLELQLQGDDLVEVFLVFSQNVFGLEPATVRVREVRIGRAERRAARRRARGNRPGESTSGQQDGDPEDETNVSVTVGVAVAPSSSDAGGTEDGSDRPSSPTLVAAEHPSAQSERPSTPADAAPSTSAPPEELLAVAPPTAGPYTTFQQLNFAPRFPLASIADDYIIPPTYPSFLQYRSEHEPEVDADAASEPTPAGFSPPGLPVPTPTTPPQWYYRDPKGVVHGPWKSSLMQAWYKQGLLPPDLPVRRAEDEEFILLKELRLQSVDPIQPFNFPPTEVPPPPAEVEKPLLLPISLLSQPRHFGPPALFFSSRGGHSTSIVDSRGRSVLKGKFVWTDDNSEDASNVVTKMGDIKRLEAFDVQDKSVLVAMRQGGLEVVDLRDALLKPADESRTILPNYTAPSGEINRRPPFVWRIGTPISLASSATPFGALSQKSKSGFGGHLSHRKASISSGKATGGHKADGSGSDPTDPEAVDGVFFVGRNEDEIYFCEKNAGSFRILRLAPH